MLEPLTKHLYALAACVVLFGAALAQAPPERVPEEDRELLEKVRRLLRWQAYWEGPNALRGYRAGQAVPMRIVRSAREIAVFLASAGVKARFPLSPGGSLLPPVSSVLAAPETNETASRQYVHDLNLPVAPDCIPVGSKGPRPQGATAASIPAARACVDPGSGSRVRQEDVEFALQHLALPEGVVHGTLPPGFDELKALLAGFAVSFGMTRCGPTEATVPYMFEEDPLLYVLIQWCGNRGVQIVARNHEGKWELSKLLLSGMDDVPRLADLISRTAATRVSLN